MKDRLIAGYWRSLYTGYGSCISFCSLSCKASIKDHGKYRCKFSVMYWILKDLKIF